MKSEDIYDAVGDIGDDLINEASGVSKRARLGRGALIAASVVLVLCIGLSSVWIMLMPPANSGGKGGSGAEYMYYGGPVLPLTAECPIDGASIKRNVSYDFSKFEDGYGSGCFVTDTYTVNVQKNVSLKLSYPYCGTLSGVNDDVPIIKNNNVAVMPALGIGATLSDVERISSFEDYRPLLSSDAYRENAYIYPLNYSHEVTVYEINDYVIIGEGRNPTLRVSFNIDYTKTALITKGMNGKTHSPETGYCARSFSVPSEGEYGYGESFYIIVIGDDIGRYELQGFEDGGCDKGEEIEIKANVTRYKAELTQILTEISGIEEHSDGIMGMITNDQKSALLCRYLNSYVKKSEDGTVSVRHDSVEMILSEILHKERILYLDFEIELQAGEMTVLEASFFKRAHEDFVGNGQYRNGYDLSAFLGSNLDFQEVTATLKGVENIEILYQNFGFDVDKGILSVTLDRNVGYYRIDVALKEDDN